jgi:hypothetical protein
LADNGEVRIWDYDFGVPINELGDFRLIDQSIKVISIFEPSRGIVVKFNSGGGIYVSKNFSKEMTNYYDPLYKTRYFAF